MNNWRYVFLSVFVILFLACSGNDKQESSEAAAEVAEQSDETELKAALTEMIKRISYGDKTAFYENEFQYYRDEISLSEYMELHRVKDYAFDTLRGIAFDSVRIMGDSAIVWAEAIYESKAGGEVRKAYPPLKMYNFQGRWIWPYMSRGHARDEIEYLDELRRYDSDAAAEEKEGL